jgi:rod shape-determining protein MreC
LKHCGQSSLLAKKMSIAHKPRVIVAVALFAVILINARVFGGRMTAWVADHTGAWLAPVASRAVALRALISTFVYRGDLAAENRSLQDQLIQARAQSAQHEDLEQELVFYRAAAGIREHLGAQPIEAGIFSYPQDGGIWQAVLDRGSADWVAVGDAVATAGGALVGVVDRVFDRHATVRMVGDANMQVTARVAGTDISGLVRTDGAGTVLLDLLQKDETVTEGQTVVTSGDDHYPAGLVIGTIRSIDNDAATLFQIVRLTPAVPSGGVSGRVIVIGP